jgi:hypothetical protein
VEIKHPTPSRLQNDPIPFERAMPRARERKKERPVQNGMTAPFKVEMTARRRIDGTVKREKQKKMENCRVWIMFEILQGRELN